MPPAAYNLRHDEGIHETLSLSIARPLDARDRTMMERALGLLISEGTPGPLVRPVPHKNTDERLKFENSKH